MSIDLAIETIISEASPEQRRTLLAIMERGYNAGQPRDDHGRFATGDGGRSSPVDAPAGASGKPADHRGVDFGEIVKQIYSPAEMALPGESRHPHKTEEATYKAEAAAKPTFDVALDTGKGVDKAIGAVAVRPSDHNEFMAALHGEKPAVIIAGLKGLPRAREKVNGKYGGDWTKLGDVVRATVAVNSKEEVGGALQAVKDNFSKHGWELAEKPGDRMTTPMPGGYRDFQLKMRHKESGMVAEVQVNTKSMMLAKESGHKLYEEFRTIKEGAIGRQMTPKETSRAAELEAKMEKTYEEAWR